MKMPRINPLDSVSKLFRLQLFHPQFPDYPLYSPVMTKTVVLQERARLLDLGLTVIVQDVFPDLGVAGRINLQDFG
jgi:hypothetical protein